METIGIETLKNEKWTEYYDDNVAFLGNVSNLPALRRDNSYQLNMILGVWCRKGKFSLKVDNDLVTLKANQTLVLPSGSVMSDLMNSPDFEAIAIGFNLGFFDRDIYLNNNTWKYYTFLINNRVVDVQPADMELLGHYYAILQTNLSASPSTKTRQVIHNIEKAFVYQVAIMIERVLPESEPQRTHQDITSNAITNHFLKILALSEGRRHKVKDFADELCIAPKYLALTVREATGKTPLQWIHEYTAREIERQLKYSNKSIKEICNDLQFSTLSFFTRFVKTHLGDTATNIRQMRDKR